MTEPPTPPDSRLVALVAGKYEVVRLIGRGGMGSVWEGRHATLGTHVAIKFIDQEYANSRDAQTRFVNEARAAATIQSKHAIQIFDHGVAEDGRPYIVMELLTGEPLDRRLDRLGRISLQDTARMIGQVCRALQRAHDAGIIHRDLKPENIFLVRSPDDDDEIAKVLDFGIAKMKGPPGGKGLTSSTKTGAVLGTPYFMSPEQARGLRTIDHRSDLWSLGVIAYKCVTGALPFEGESVGDLLVKICTSPPPTPSLAAPGLPPAFDAWFARALEREPANRHESATALADGLLLSAGLSARRGATPNLSSLQGLPTSFGVPLSANSSPVAPTVMTPMPAAGRTSSPFTTSASPPGARKKTARGLLVALVAAIVGGSVGVGAVVKLLSPAPLEAPATAPGAASKPTPSLGTLAVALTANTPTAPVLAVPSAASPTPKPSSPASPASAHVASRTPGPVPSRPPSPILPSSAPASPWPGRSLPSASPSSADPGY